MDPKPTPELLAEFYSGDYHDDLRQDGATEQRFGPKFESYLQYLASHLKPRSRVLDIGCATGLLVKMLADQGHHAEGIELNPSSAAWGRRHFGVMIHDQPIEECGIEPGSLDAVIMADVLEHTLHPRDYLAMVGEYLAPDGIVLITFPDINSIESRYYYLLARLLRRSWLWFTCHIPLHTWEFTPETARACFEAAGFQVAEFRRSHDTDSGGATGVLKVISLPPSLIRWAPLATRFGTQMEFVIRRAVA